MRYEKYKSFKNIMSRMVYCICLGLLLFMVACTDKHISEEVEIAVEAEDVAEVEEINIEEDKFNYICIQVQRQLDVFDTSVYEEPLMKAIYKKMPSVISRDVASEIIEECLVELFPTWHRKIVISTLDFELGKGLYTPTHVERIIRKTSIEPLLPLIREYVIVKLKSEGKIKEN